MSKVFWNSIKYGTLATTLLSCGGYNYRSPESIESKMTRFESNPDFTNTVPKLMVKDFTFKKRSRQSRSIASVNDKDTGLNLHTNKRLYFTTLYKQYTQFKAFTPKGTFSELKICPNFHTSLINFKEKYGNHTNYKSYDKNIAALNFNDQQMLAAYPELMLPLDEVELRPTALDLIKKNKSDASNIVTNAIVTHVGKIKKELMELCETGASTNYYIYENLVAHVKNHGPLSSDKEGVTTLFKTTIFSNMAIYNSIDKQAKTRRGLASFNNSAHYKENYKRLNADWIKDYYQR